MNDFLLILLIGIIFIIFYFVIQYIERRKHRLFDFDRDTKNVKKPEIMPEKKQDTNQVLIGKCQDRNVYLPKDCKHVYVCGTTGAGKTVALSNFIKTAYQEDIPMLIIDGKGSIKDNSLLDIVMTLNIHNKKVYVINLNDPLHSDKYNPFCNTTPTIIKDMLINLNDWSEEHYKLNTERYLQRVIQVLYQADIPLSFSTILKYMDTDAFLTLSATLLKSEKITKEEHLANGQLAKSSGEIAKDSIARFSNLLESDIGIIFDESGIDIYTALKENAIILFILNPLMYPEISPTFGRLITIDSKKAVARFLIEDIKRIFFLFDEVNVYASKTLLDLINKSREANVTCIPASQSLSDLEEAESEGFKQQMIENCNNYIIMRQNSHKNAEEWAQIIGTKESHEITYQIDSESTSTKGSYRNTREFVFHPDDIKSLDVGEAFVISKDKKFKYRVKVNKPF